MNLLRNKCKREIGVFEIYQLQYGCRESIGAALRQIDCVARCLRRAGGAFRFLSYLHCKAKGNTRMADEVTKKDLQSLQGYVNKQVKEIEGRLKKAEGNISVLKDVPTSQDNIISDQLNKVADYLQKQIWKLQADVDALKKQ
jgi:hypothetical protein